MPFTTYITASRRNGTLYTGHTDGLGRRMEQHIHGDFPGFSKRHGCKHLVWFEDFSTREEAFMRERRIKEWKRAWKIELIETFNPHWLDVYQCPMWPPPDGLMHAEVYARCMATALPR